jgi:GT2 family glycosyltransferase
METKMDPATGDPWDRITVVLVTRNSEAALPTSLGSLPKAKRIILFDALSTDGTVDAAKAAHPNVEVVSLGRDRGLGAATNMGFALAKTEYVLNINPDTRLLEGCAEQLVRTANANPNAAIVAPLLTNDRGRMDLHAMGPRELHHHEIKVVPEGPFCTWFVTGAVVLWRLSAFKDVGGFDENIFLYNEDADICVRATQKGYCLIIDPTAEGDHFGGQSEKVSLKSRIRRDRNMTWGQLYYERKYGGPDEADHAARQLIRKCAGQVLLGLLTGRPRKVITNVAKARAAYAYLKRESPWERP